MLRRLKDNKGFTLVEVIVVLVILAILAGIMVPTMTGWIDKAKKQGLIAPCRTCVVAAQSLASEGYALVASAEDITIDNTKIIELAGLAGRGEVTEVELDTASVTIRKLTYKDTASGDSVTYLRDPEPHYEIKAGSGKSDAETAQETLAKMGDIFKSLNYTKNSIDSLSQNTEGSFAKQIFSGLTPEQQAFLNNKTWAFIKNNSTGEYRLYFTETDYGEGSSDGNTTLYKYNFDTKLYQKSERGRVKNGKIDASTSEWGSWLTYEDMF